MPVFREEVFPFCAIVGQEAMKEALLLNIVDPSIGGVLLRGKKGSAKSTASRALQSILGSGTPFCTLPLSATEDMVVGSIDFEEALRSGAKKFFPGILAKVHTGILYIDEVNLLNNHLAELLLDVCASGVNRVEREGVSYIHASRFCLIGTMNPEEGEVSPQLLDRFGLSVAVDNEQDVLNRVEIIKRREEFDRDRKRFILRFQDEEGKIREAVVKARAQVKDVFITEQQKQLIAEIVTKNNCAGHRADILIGKTARAIAALGGRLKVDIADIQKAGRYVLPHRLREQNEPPGKQNNPQRNDAPKEDTPKNNHNHGDNQPQGADKDNKPSPAPKMKKLPSPARPEMTFEVGETFSVKRINCAKDRIFRKGSGRRSRTKTKQKLGRYVRSVIKKETSDIALDATIRAAAVQQKQRRGTAGVGSLGMIIREEDIRSKQREKKTGNFILFVVDASGSMGAYRRMVETKGAIMSLLLDAYQKRDKVGMIAFRKDKAECLLAPTSSVDLAARKLKELPVGGKTPLASAFALAYETLRAAFFKDKTIRPIVVIITDGKANVSCSSGDPVQEALGYSLRIADEIAAKYVVIDTEPPGVVTLGLARQIAVCLNAEYYRLPDIRSEELFKISREIVNQ
ncbi:MAG: magnesium chelatase subunit D family protein [Candidatus Omnitrophota bacterium]|nr:magnesium chelatase subunit D family protein [Candidatus Omnitrophota bacterium]